MVSTKEMGYLPAHPPRSGLSFSIYNKERVTMPFPLQFGGRFLSEWFRCSLIFARRKLVGSCLVACCGRTGSPACPYLGLFFRRSWEGCPSPTTVSKGSRLPGLAKACPGTHLVDFGGGASTLGRGFWGGGVTGQWAERCGTRRGLCAGAARCGASDAGRSGPRAEGQSAPLRVGRGIGCRTRVSGGC